MTAVSKRFDDLGSDGAPARLGIMGGTFDPIHLGHLRIAEEVREELALDAVLFVPTGNPVFKRDQYVTDAQVRLDRVRRAVEDNPHFDVSSIEVDREGDTFTVDTLRELRAYFPSNVDLYFIVGSDSAATIGKWRGCAEIAQLAHVAVAVGRPGSMGIDELRATMLSAAPFNLHFVKTSILEISSSSIRNRIEQGKSIRYLVPDWRMPRGTTALASRQGAADHNVDDVLSDEFFEARKAELQTRVKPKRFNHSLGVSQACEQLAKRFGLDVRKARLAGLLHDWDKGYDDEGARARVYELGMEDEVDPWVVENMPMVLHGETAAVALARTYPDIPADVLQAISRHTTATEDMEPLDMALYIADAIEPSRQFGRIDELRAAVSTHSLEELYFETYEYWVFLLFERGKPLHPDTIRIWNSYTMKHPRKSGKKKKEKREK
jgi:nicotinate (nicotinamide) nucleotide adenylyltransferase